MGRRQEMNRLLRMARKPTRDDWGAYVCRICDGAGSSRPRHAPTCPLLNLRRTRAAREGERNG